MPRKRLISKHVTCTSEEERKLIKAEKVFRRMNGGGTNSDMSRFLRELGLEFYESLKN